MFYCVWFHDVLFQAFASLTLSLLFIFPKSPPDSVFWVLLLLSPFLLLLLFIQNTFLNPSSFIISQFSVLSPPSFRLVLHQSHNLLTLFTAPLTSYSSHSLHQHSFSFVLAITLSSSLCQHDVNTATTGDTILPAMHFHTAHTCFHSVCRR